MDDDIDNNQIGSVVPVEEGIVKKSKVGRPKSNLTDIVIPKLGIINEPTNLKEAKDDPQSVYVMELEYDCTTLIGKLFELIERICVNDLYFYFTPEGLTILTKISGDMRGIADDQTDPGEVYVNMSGAKSNLYYLQKPITIIINKNVITKRLISPSKHFNSIKFTITEQSLSSSNSLMDIRMTYFNNHSEDCTKVPFLKIPDTTQTLEVNHFYNIYNYPLRFRASMAYMKIVIITAQTSLIKYIKFYYHEKRFELLHSHENYGEDKTTHFKSLEKINFIHDGEENNIISATVEQKILSDIISKDIANTVQVYVDDSMPLGLEFNLEQETQNLSKIKDKFYIRGSEKIKIICLVKQHVATVKK